MDAQVSAFQTSSGRALASCLANSWGVTRMMLSIVVGYCKHVRKPYTNLKNNFFFFFFFLWGAYLIPSPTGPNEVIKGARERRPASPHLLRDQLKIGDVKGHVGFAVEMVAFTHAQFLQPLVVQVDTAFHVQRFEHGTAEMLQNVGGHGVAKHCRDHSEDGQDANTKVGQELVVLQLRVLLFVERDQVDLGNLCRKHAGDPRRYAELLELGANNSRKGIG